MILSTKNCANLEKTQFEFKCIITNKNKIKNSKHTFGSIDMLHLRNYHVSQKQNKKARVKIRQIILNFCQLNQHFSEEAGLRKDLCNMDLNTVKITR